MGRCLSHCPLMHHTKASQPIGSPPSTHLHLPLDALCYDLPGFWLRRLVSAQSAKQLAEVDRLAEIDRHPFAQSQVVRRLVRQHLVHALQAEEEEHILGQL